MNITKTQNMILIDQGRLRNDVTNKALIMKANDGLTMSDRMDREGVGHSAVWQTRQTYEKYQHSFNLDEYENANVYGACLPIRLRNICEIFGLDHTDYILKKVEKPVVQPQPETVTTVIDNTELIAKVDELIGTVNKLGNILMQMLEYDKVELNNSSECLSELKRLNDKYNKPSAYIKK